MVNFMLQRPRQQSGAGNTEPFSLTGQSFHTHTRIAVNLAKETGYRKAAFLPAFLSLTSDNFRIDQFYRAVADINYHNTQRYAYLRRRKAPARSWTARACSRPSGRNA